MESLKIDDQFLIDIIPNLGEKKLSKIKENLGEQYLKIILSSPKECLKILMSKQKRDVFNEWLKCFFVLENNKLSLKNINLEEVNVNLSKKSLVEWEKVDKLAIKEELDLLLALSSNANILLYNELKKLKAYVDIIFDLKVLGYEIETSKNLIKEYRLETLDKVFENPYLPVLYGETFKKSDTIAISKIGISQCDGNRILYSSIELLKQNEKKGNLYLEMDILIRNISLALNIDAVDFIGDILFLESIKSVPEIIIDENRVYRRVIYYTEKKIAEKIKELMVKNSKTKSDVLYRKCKSFIEKSSLCTSQKQQLLNIIQYNISILGGGPGTGKTTCIKILAEAILNTNQTVALCSPTGKAAKRLSFATGIDAFTIHRLLGYTKLSSDTYGFVRNENYLLPYDYIILDEASMIDVFCMNGLLNAMKKTASIILVGDVDQLPSVGAGSLLKDLKESGVIPYFELTEIFRQKKESSIVENARNFLFSKKSLCISDEFKYVEVTNEEDLSSYLEKIADIENYQILTPVIDGPFGVREINNKIQSFNSDADYLRYEDKAFYKGDFVIQIKSNNLKGLVNGDIGVVQEIFSDGMTVKFEEKEIYYYLWELGQLELSYAITIHKFQGSEKDNVLVVVDPTRQMLSRELIYTAMTRAKKNLILVSTVPIEMMDLITYEKKRSTNMINLLLN